MLSLKKPGLVDFVRLAVTVYSSDIVLKIKRGADDSHVYSGGKRERVDGFSRSSARRLSFYIRNTAAVWSVLATLTYPREYPHDGKVVKKHLHAFIEFLRRRKIRYVWVLEFQERGAPHFHFLLSGFLEKEELAQAWFRIVDSGDLQHLWAGTRVETIAARGAMAQYMAKYAAKQEQKRVPVDYQDCGRFWGASRLIRKDRWYYEGTYAEVASYLRVYRRWYRAACRAQGFRWKWSGFGFCLRGAAGTRMEIGLYSPAVSGSAVERLRPFPLSEFTAKEQYDSWQREDQEQGEESADGFGGGLSGRLP